MNNKLEASENLKKDSVTLDRYFQKKMHTGNPLVFE